MGNPDSASADHLMDQFLVPDGYLTDDPVHAVCSFSNRPNERNFFTVSFGGFCLIWVLINSPVFVFALFLILYMVSCDHVDRILDRQALLSEPGVQLLGICFIFCRFADFCFVYLLRIFVFLYVCIFWINYDFQLFYFVLVLVRSCSCLCDITQF